ncbi:MAG: energy-coupling factor ABC transporter ATP-binding protein, partial [Planctomycetaceae bacterium]
MRDNSEPVLQVERLRFRYPGGPLVLEDVTWSMAADEVVGIVGPSGAGKSTLLWHLNGLLPDPTPTGRDGALPMVRVAGRPVHREHLAEIRRRVGLVFQDPDDQLFCPTVREDVAFGPLNLGLGNGEVEQRIT